mgnify:CR=1 FL=1
MLCNIVCILLYPVWGVGHGRAQGSVADHGEVVETVANGNGFGRGKAVEFSNPVNGSGFGHLAVEKFQVKRLGSAKSNILEMGCTAQLFFYLLNF